MDKLTTSGKFTFGLLIAGALYTAFVLQEADVGEMIDAEAEVGPGTIVAFNAALMARQLQSVSKAEGKTVSGPFTSDRIKRLRPADYRALRDAQGVLETLGNGGQPANQDSSTVS